MNNNPSPLEYLASFAITFAAGMAASAALRAYAQWASKHAAASGRSN